MINRDKLLEAASLVEKWWLDEGRHHFDGAPAAMFELREALSGSEPPHPKGTIAPDEWRAIQRVADKADPVPGSDRGEFGVKPFEQVIGVIRELSTLANEYLRMMEFFKTNDSFAAYIEERRK